MAENKLNYQRNLPPEFFEYMKKTLGADYDEYIAQFDKEPFRGLRVNTLKSSNEQVSELLGIEMKTTPFCDNGFYISNSISGLGNHPLHHAGAFYLQEPSAMSAVTALDVQKGDNVLDLCAAPGGKSTQISAALGGEGVLISNEIVQSRAKILASNIERMGVCNAVVTNASPDVICDELCGWADKVLVDAPCSGEGMLRREKAAVDEWKLENHEMCKLRTANILDSAALAVRSGGVLVYSTCTLSAEENEQTVARFLDRHPEFSLSDITADFGRAAYSNLCDNADITKARRILYQDGGEGHFVARMVKNDSAGDGYTDAVSGSDKIPIFEQFYYEHFYGECKNAHLVRDNVYIYPDGMPKLNKTRIVKAGVMAGKIVGKRFEPSHDIYMSRRFDEHRNIIDLDRNSDEIKRFLHGETINCDKKGYCAVAVNGIVTGFGKASNGVLKNHYPKGLRTLNV